jgi:hypothetical protein
LYVEFSGLFEKKPSIRFLFNTGIFKNPKAAAKDDHFAVTGIVFFSAMIYFLERERRTGHPIHHQQIRKV